MTVKRSECAHKVKLHPFREKPPWEGAKVCECPCCHSRCWVLASGRSRFPCAGCLPLKKWASEVHVSR